MEEWILILLSRVRGFVSLKDNPATRVSHIFDEVDRLMSSSASNVYNVLVSISCTVMTFDLITLLDPEDDLFKQWQERTPSFH